MPRTEDAGGVPRTLQAYLHVARCIPGLGAIVSLGGVGPRFDKADFISALEN